MTPAQRQPSFYILAASSGDNSVLADFESAWGRFFQHLNEPRARAAYARLTPQAFGPTCRPRWLESKMSITHDATSRWMKT